MQVLVQHRDTAGDVLRLFIQLADIVVYQFPDRLKILLLPVKGQGFAHFAVQVGQVCKGGQAAACLKGQTLELGQGGLFSNELRPALHGFTGDADAFCFTRLCAFHNGRAPLRVSGTSLHSVQLPGRIPKARQGGEYWLKIRREIFDFQLWQRIGC